MSDSTSNPGLISGHAKLCASICNDPEPPPELTIIIATHPEPKASLNRPLDP